MLRTRLLWFTLGFSVTGASIAHIVWRDLYAERFAISSDVIFRVCFLKDHSNRKENGSVSYIRRFNAADEGEIQCSRR